MAFISLRDADGLAWHQASLLARAIELTGAGGLAGILRFHGMGRQCDATAAEGMWSFRREGFLWRHAGIVAMPGDKPVGRVSSGIARSRLTLVDGTVYDFNRMGFWSGERAFVTTSEFAVVRFQPRRLTFRPAGEIVIAREYSALPELPLLTLLGVFLTVMEQRRARS